MRVLRVVGEMGDGEMGVSGTVWLGVLREREGRALGGPLEMLRESLGLVARESMLAVLLGSGV